MSADGTRKIDALVQSVPKNAVAVLVSVAAVFVSLATPEENLTLARNRAATIVKELRARGVVGEYSVSVSTSFTVDDDGRTGTRANRSADRALTVAPVVDDSGKPLTTVAISFIAPASP